MSDHSQLLDDPATAEIVLLLCDAPAGARVVGLHDNVEVQETLARTMEVVRRPTVEVVMVTRAGRPFAARFKMTLAEFMAWVGAKTAA